MDDASSGGRAIMDGIAGALPMSSSPGEITLLLTELKQGNSDAETKLMPLVYQRLRQLAAQQLRRERRGHTLQATDLVQELYLRVVKPRLGQWENRVHFYAAAAGAMRLLLVDYARAHNAGKRRGKLQKVDLDEALVFSSENPEDFLALDEALTRLADFAPRQSRIVELRFFTGLSVKETAEALRIGATTVKSEWRLARAWLRRELEGAP
jgi:RNA polymerase sigma-70 factor (ECF subfamily)